MEITVFSEDELLNYLDEIEGHDQLDKLKYFSYQSKSPLVKELSYNVYVCAINHEGIVGAAIVRRVGEDPKLSAIVKGFDNWLMSISVNEVFQNQGIGKALVEETFDYLSSQGADNLLVSTYSADGDSFIKKHIQRKAKSMNNFRLKEND